MRKLSKNNLADRRRRTHAREKSVGNIRMRANKQFGVEASERDQEKMCAYLWKW